MKPEQVDRLRALGRNWNADISGHRQEVLELFKPLVARGPKDGVTVMRDQPYGSDPRQVLDVFWTKGRATRPVVVFIHGGAFTRGSKSLNGEVYDNVLFWFARHGFVGINLEYRLAPAAPFPAPALDVASAVRWVEANIAAYGGDPGRIVLIGHSAGGTHLGSYLLDPNAGCGPADGVCAAIFISSRLRLDLRADNPNAKNVAAYAGTDRGELEARSPVSHAGRCRWPVMVAFSEFENRHLDTYALEFAHRIAEKNGKAPRVVQSLGHNHTSIVAAFNTGDDALGDAVLRFLAEECGIPASSPAERQ